MYLSGPLGYWTGYNVRCPGVVEDLTTLFGLSDTDRSCYVWFTLRWPLILPKRGDTTSVEPIDIETQALTRSLKTINLLWFKSDDEHPRSLSYYSRTEAGASEGTELSVFEPYDKALEN